MITTEVITLGHTDLLTGICISCCMKPTCHSHRDGSHVFKCDCAALKSLPSDKRLHVVFMMKHTFPWWRLKRGFSLVSVTPLVKKAEVRKADGDDSTSGKRCNKAPSLCNEANCDWTLRILPVKSNINVYLPSLHHISSVFSFAAATVL